jgi:AraC family transcriptional regulator of adaptative response / DNA-3-methyladenine glycosylase II
MVPGVKRLPGVGVPAEEGLSSVFSSTADDYQAFGVRQLASALQSAAIHVRKWLTPLANRHHNSVMSPELCYAASRSRDPRFDGRFFIAVVTTGIYCRPICPAPPALRKNVRYYPTAAAAEAAGFRPCKRCRPETAPGTPAWSGTSATVARALRIIDETPSLDHLASRLGITDRHLRRLFEEHVGAPPIAILQTRRLHLARTLLRDTSLSIADVAFGAGFESVRRFNDAMRKAYGCTPSELRGKNVSEGSVSIRLTFRPPFRWEAIAKFLGDRAIDGIESFDGVRYVRAPVTIEPNGNALVMKLPMSFARDIHAFVARARRTFDLAADPIAIDEHLRKDKLLRPLLARRPAPRVPGAWEPFEVAVRAIVGQQITVRAATTIMNRCFATSDWSGMPKSRIIAIRSLERAFADDPSILTRGASLDETIERLTSLPGIGPWTAHYIAMRALAEPDAFPHTDLGLRKAAAAIGIDPAKLLAHAERWRPWRAYAAIALWESL